MSMTCMPSPYGPTPEARRAMSADLIAQLRGIVGEAHVLTDAVACAPYEEDWRRIYRGRALCVVRPASTAQVSAVVKACAAAGVAMVPQGGNTGHVGGGVPRSGGDEVVVSLGRMNRIRQVDTDNNTMTVEAGCVLQTVQEAAAAHDRLFPLSLAAQGSCVIGGNLASNAGGVQVLRYGTARDLTLGLEVVLADGRVWDGLRVLRKDNTGYDLRDLFIGSEGTLGIITAAVLKLFPRPRARVVAWAGLASVEDAIALLGELRSRCAERMSAFEIVGAVALDLVVRHIPGSVVPLTDAYPWHALVELSDTGPESALRDLLEEALGSALEGALISDAAMAASEAQAEALWALRESLAEAQRSAGVSIKHDLALPVSQIPAFLRQAEASLTLAFPGVRIVAFGHAGDGNLHYNLSMTDAQANAAFVARSAEVNRLVHDIVAGLGGSISAEHGLGQLRREEIRRYKSPLELELMHRIKLALDPAGLLNPGKLLDN